MEPTPGAGPCLEDLKLVADEDLIALKAKLEGLEFTYFDVLLHANDAREVYIRCVDRVECLEVVELRVKRCGAHADLTALREAGVKGIALEGDCVEVIYGAAMIARVLESEGLRPPLKILGYRPVDHHG